MRALANASGVITDTYDFVAFGELVAQVGTTTNPYLYNGLQSDSPSGLYRLRARYYAPVLGHFISRDMANLVLRNSGEHNRYVYTADNPINAVDPRGLQPFVEYSQKK